MVSSPPTNDPTNALIQRGGGTGPMKPRQPAHRRGANSGRRDVWEMRGRPRISRSPFSSRRGFAYCEAATKTGFVILLGEITTLGQLDFDTLARKVITGIGYDDSSKGFDGNTCAVQVAVAKQSGDIALGVNHSYQSRSHAVSDDEVENLGAGDQGMMFGFACDETEIIMPQPIHLAHRLTRRVAQVRKSGELPWMRPAGQSQVTIEYRQGRPARGGTGLINT